MESGSKKEYRYPLVEEPPPDFKCPLCLDILVTPMLTGCCGHHFCEQCVTDLRQKAKSAAEVEAGSEISCPMCKSKGDEFVLVLDKRTDRMLRSLKVECRNKREGCHWQGVVDGFEEHVRRECELTRWECPKGCGALLRSSEIEQHLLSACPDVLVSCPNGCEVTPLFRKHIEAHLGECPMRPASCRFASAGCVPTLCHKDVARHMESYTQTHLCMLLELTANLQEALAGRDQRLALLERKLHEKDREIAGVNRRLDEERRKFDWKLEQQSSVMDASICEAAELKDRLQALEKLVAVPPYLFTLTSYSKHKQGRTTWTSAPFYTSIGGYKMLVEVFANGEAAGKNTHVSLYIRVMRGEYDDRLKWPLSAKVTVQLVSQAERHQGHELTTPTFTWERVLDGAIGNGWGWDKFIAHEQLDRYLKKDRLNFSVVCVNDVVM